MTVVKKEQILLLQRPGAKPERVHLATELKSGGAGTIYSIKEDSNRVIKLYHAETLKNEGASYQEKIECMLGNVPHISEIAAGSDSIVQLAWPLASAHTLKGEFVGFAMPIIDLQRTTELEYILSPKQAQQNGLTYNLGVAVTLAFNLASIVESIHARGHAIVDLKPNNLKYYIHELNIAVLDCDGFYIKLPGKVSEAPQVTPDYLAPEFQEAPVNNPEHQDRFALAVIIFKLLNFDIHPYGGVAKNGANVPAELEEKIKEGLYPYGIVPNKKVSPVPASIHEAIPSELRSLFDRAFAGKHSLRPKADEWVVALRKFAEKNKGLLERCGSQHLHFKDMPCGTCMREQLIGIASANHKSAAGKHVNVKRHPSNAPSATPQPSFTHASNSPVQQSSAPHHQSVPQNIGWNPTANIPSTSQVTFSAPKTRSFKSSIFGMLILALAIWLVWKGGAILLRPAPDKTSVAIDSSPATKDSSPVVIQNSAVNQFLKAARKSKLDVANIKFSAALSEYLDDKNATKDSYSKFLGSVLILAKRDIDKHKPDEAEKILIDTNSKLFSPEIETAQSSPSSKLIECQLASMLSSLYLSERNFPEAIATAQKSTSMKLFTVDKDTEAAINVGHFVLAESLLMSNQIPEAESQYENVRVDMLPESAKLLNRVMHLVARARSNQVDDLDFEARNQFATIDDVEMNATLDSIKKFSDGIPGGDENVKVAEKIVEAKERHRAEIVDHSFSK